ncbi:Lrp/AsnC family transcriptional regulator [Amycolatopsis albispora]|uniref:AsnC family transcriptional regulator n=1 Tax=Amycolatopsis albispora TaxID=1804986 RepID=A0A344L0R4_9PSEU|nr:Lrp/AsnC family transcriptional regulator [Amycolatopsis albispora]AXB41638.1 AsnC family transcriptional regulator [Amycolatopsis albispora]
MTFDELDRAVLHALHVDGRAPFNQIAAVLGTSQQTVARRYRRLRSDGVLRVVGMTDARRLGQVEWFLRLHCTPDSALPVARALARRADTSWVQLTSGGTEISCVIRAPGGNAPEALLLQQLPKTPRVVSVSAHCLLRSFVGGPVGWHGRAGVLTGEQIARLRPDFGPAVSEVDITGDDRLLAALRRDGRATFAELAAATGLSEPTVRRRVNQLRASGILYLDIDLDAAVLGFHAQAILWLSVRPAHLVAAAEALARQPEVALAAITTGPANLLAKVVCRDVDALYACLTERVGTIEAIDRLETAPVIRTLKRAATAKISG